MSTVRQAVVVVHGMGEQRPQQTLQGFVDAALSPRGDGTEGFYSEPDRVSTSFESRLYRAPRDPAKGEPEVHAQTDFYEYHWAHLMQGNRLGDLGPMFRRMLLRWPWRVPAGLRPAWVLFWALGVLVLWAVALGPLRGVPLGDNRATGLIQGLLGAGVLSTAVVYVVTKVLPGALTVSFVDVVRYLDTSPRSYAVRAEIRKGMVELLRELHQVGRSEDPPKAWRQYDRVVVVAHSLGAYIAYDGISYLWSQCGDLLGATPAVPAGNTALATLERHASDLPAWPDRPAAAQVTSYQAAQREFWSELRRHGSPWLITDFISVGTPMCMADDLYTRGHSDWEKRVQLRELATCPPQRDLGRRDNEPDDRTTGLRLTYPLGGRRYVHHAAPFAPVRWTNLWFPSRWGVFGDWFGGPLAPLFGTGVRDVPVTARGLRWAPALAHTRYFAYPEDLRPESPTTRLRAALDLASTAWLRPPPPPTGAAASAVNARARSTTPRRPKKTGAGS